MQDVAIVKTNRDQYRPKPKDDAPLASLTIDFTDNGGGTVRMIPKSKGEMPFGGDSKLNAFESREALAKFVSDKILGAVAAEAAAEVAPVAEAVADVAAGPVQPAL